MSTIWVLVSQFYFHLRSQEENVLENVERNLGISNPLRHLLQRKLASEHRYTNSRFKEHLKGVPSLLTIATYHPSLLTIATAHRADLNLHRFWNVNRYTMWTATRPHLSNLLHELPKIIEEPHLEKSKQLLIVTSTARKRKEEEITGE